MRVARTSGYWTVEDAQDAYGISRQLVESYDSAGILLPQTLTSKARNWIKYCDGIVKNPARSTVVLRESQYAVSKVVVDSILELTTEVSNKLSQSSSSGANTVVGKTAIEALLFPFSLAKSPKNVKEVVNKLIENRDRFERGAGTDLSQILAILLRFRDKLSKNGFYSSDEMKALLSGVSPFTFDRVKEFMEGNGRNVLSIMEMDGISSIGSICQSLRIAADEAAQIVDDLDHNLLLPIHRYASDPRIITLSIPAVHLWQLHGSVEARLNHHFCSNQNLEEVQSIADLRSTASQRDFSFSKSLEENVTELASERAKSSRIFDDICFPIEDPYIVGEMLWAFDGLPQSICLLSRERKREILSGTVKYLMREKRNESLTKNGLNFSFLSERTSRDFYRLLRDDFHIRCKRPTENSCVVFDTGILELSRNLALANEERLVLLRSYSGSDEIPKLEEIDDEGLYVRIISDLLIEKGGLSDEQIADDLLVSESVVRDLLNKMMASNQSFKSNNLNYFAVDLDALSAVINDDRIRKALCFEG